MIIFVAVDDNNGMMFHNRRQSQDVLLRERLLEKCQGNKLWMNAYTSKQFETPLPEHVIIEENFLERAEKGEFCFVENLSLAPYWEKIERLIVFRWNRVYPADMWLDITLAEDGWKLLTTTEFVGNSHEKITEEEWVSVYEIG